MSELQQIKLWDDWDEINLSTRERRIERLEILLCQKVKKGEDISQCLRILEYLKNETVEQKLQDVFVQRVKQKLIFDYWKKVGATSLVILITITCYVVFFTCLNSLRASQDLYKLSSQRHQIKIIPPPDIKHSKKFRHQ